MVGQSRVAPLNALGLGSLPSTQPCDHEGVVPDPLMCATLHAPVESSLDELWAADEAAAVVVPTPHAHHRSPSIGFTGYDVNTLPSFTRALAPGGSVAATPTIQHQGGALDGECKEGQRPKRLCTHILSLNDDAALSLLILLRGLPVPLLAHPQHQLCWIWLMLHSTTPLTRLKGALTRAPELAHYLYLTHCMAA